MALQGDAWDGVAMPRRIFAVLAVMCAVSLSVIDGVIANIALPTICDNLDISSSDSVWIINAYQIAIVMSLLPLSALGDYIGFRKLYISGLILFTCMSVGCAFSWSLESLVAFRVLQGFGASAVMSITTSMVRIIYPKRMLGRGLGLNSTVVSVSSVLGPSVAALILSHGDWQWLFAVNIPIGTAAVIMGYLFLPENPELQNKGRFDVRSAIMNAVTFGAIFAVVTGLSHGVKWYYLIPIVAIAVGVGYRFVREQLACETPILPFDLLRIPIFSLSIVTSILTFVAQMLIMVAIPFVLHNQFGFTAIEIGVVVTAWPAVNMFTTPISGVLVERFHAGVLGCIGLTALTVGVVLIALVPDVPTKWDFIWRLAICGFGFGFFQAPNNSLIIASAPMVRSGSASGMMATARLIGQISGAAIVALMLYIIPEKNSIHILYVGALFSGSAALLSFSRLSLPMPKALRSEE